MWYDTPKDRRISQCQQPYDATSVENSLSPSAAMRSGVPIVEWLELRNEPVSMKDDRRTLAPSVANSWFGALNSAEFVITKLGEAKTRGLTILTGEMGLQGLMGTFSEESVIPNEGVQPINLSTGSFGKKLMVDPYQRVG